MTQILAWVALVLGGLIVGQAGVAGLRSRPRLPAGSAAILGFAAAVLCLGALATLPVSGVWSPGQTLAPGFVLGGVSVLLVVFLGGTAAGPDPAASRAAARDAALRIAAPALGTALLVLLYASNLLDALIGFGLGAVTVGSLAVGWLGGAATEEDPRAAGVETAILGAVSLAGATYLAVFHLSPAGVREWQPLPALFASALAACLLARSAVPASVSNSAPVSTVIVFVPLAAFAALIAFRLNGTPGFLWAVLAGLVVCALVAWLQSGSGEAATGEKPATLRADFGLVSSLLVLGGGVLAFRGLHGYGLALMALAGTAVLAALPPEPAEDRRQAVGGAVALTLLLALYRVYTERNSNTSGFQPEFLYYYVALIAGALLPQLLGAWSVPPAGTGAPVPALVRLATSGLVAATAPLATWVLIGERPQAALLVGLAVGVGVLQARSVGSGVRSTSASLGRLYALGSALVAVQFTHLLAPLALRTRQDRIVLLAIVAVVALLGVGASLLLERSSHKSK